MYNPTTHVDVKYINLLSNKLEQFKYKGDNLWNFRCPLCGDSKKNKSKTRGYLYRKDGTYLFKCHNCQRGFKFEYFLRQVDRYLYDQYRMEVFQGIQQDYKSLETEKEPKVKAVSNKISLPTIESLQESHSAKKYIRQRMIPEKHWGHLFYADDFKAFADEFLPHHGKQLKPNDPRIVLPFYNSYDVLQGVQSRSLLENSLRYLLLKVDNSSEKLYGANRINFSNTIYVTEGPFDSLFVDNCVATMDLNLLSAVDILSDGHSYTFIFDNQPRNKEVCRQIRKILLKGYPVCIWPDYIEQKDVNDMVLAGIDVQSIIYTHTYEGLKAQLQFEHWRKDQ